MSDRDLFGKLLTMLRVGALAQMGLLSNPKTGKQNVNIETAKMTLDMMDMLSRKMYLEDDERQQLETILTELRIMYINLQDLSEPDTPSEDEVN